MGKWLGHVGNRKFIIHRSEATPHHWNWSGYSKFWALLPQLLGWAMHGGPVGQSGNHRVNTASSPGLFPQLALAPSGVAGGFPWQRRHLAPPAAATASRGPETWRSGGWEGFKQQKLRLNWLNQTTCGFSNVWSKTNPRTPSEFAVNTMVLSIFFSSRSIEVDGHHEIHVFVVPGRWSLETHHQLLKLTCFCRKSHSHSFTHIFTLYLGCFLVTECLLRDHCLPQGSPWTGALQLEAFRKR